MLSLQPSKAQTLGDAAGRVGRADFCYEHHIFVSHAQQSVGGEPVLESKCGTWFDSNLISTTSVPTPDHAFYASRKVGTMARSKANWPSPAASSCACHVAALEGWSNRVASTCLNLVLWDQWGSNYPSKIIKIAAGSWVEVWLLHMFGVILSCTNMCWANIEGTIIQHTTGRIWLSFASNLQKLVMLMLHAIIHE